MAGKQNPYEAAGRARKVIALIAAADRIVDRVAEGDPIDRQLALSDLIRALEQPETVTFDAWGALICSSGINPPSDETKAEAIEALRRNLVLCSAAADPFRGLSVVS